MSIDPIVPVHMAGQIFLDSSWQSTWMPVAAATISGGLTAFITWLIVSRGNERARVELEKGHEMTLKVIQESNSKALEEMKAHVESSKEIALASVAETRLIEAQKRESQYYKEWIETFSEVFSEFIKSYAHLQCLTSECIHYDKTVGPEKLTPLVLELVASTSRLYSLLDLELPLHQALYAELCRIKNETWDAFGAKEEFKDGFFPEKLFQLHWAILADQRDIIKCLDDRKAA